MKRYSLLVLLVFIVTFSSNSFAEWTKLAEGAADANRGDVFYVDFDRIRNVDGYTYFWRLTDYLKPTETGTLSFRTYWQGDCKLFRKKLLTAIPHKEPMGRGSGKVINPKNLDWVNPTPNSVDELILQSVCSMSR